MFKVGQGNLALSVCGVAFWAALLNGVSGELAFALAALLLALGAVAVRAGGSALAKLLDAGAVFAATAWLVWALSPELLLAWRTLSAWGSSVQTGLSRVSF